MYDDDDNSVATEREKLRLFSCPDCGKHFSTRFSKNRHRENIHNTASNDGRFSSDNISEKSSCADSSSGESPTSSEGEGSVVSKDKDSPTSSEGEGSVVSKDEDSVVSNDDSVISTDEDSAMSEDDSTTSEDEFDPFADFVENALSYHETEYCQFISREKHKDDEVEEERNCLRTKISRTLRRILANYILDLEDRKRDPLFKAIMRKVRDYEKEGFDVDEAIDAAVDYWKHSIIKLVPL